MKMTNHQEVLGAFRYLREIMLGRKAIPFGRFAEELSPRTSPIAALPDGPAHKLSNNYYLARHFRREIEDTVVVTQNYGVKQLPEPATEEKKVSKDLKNGRTPGNVYNFGS